MTNEEMLVKIKNDRPKQVIHEVTSFTKNAYGFYNVSVIMEIELCGTLMRKYQTTLPYPLEKYNELREMLGLK